MRSTGNLAGRRTDGWPLPPRVRALPASSARLRPCGRLVARSSADAGRGIGPATKQYTGRMIETILLRAPVGHRAASGGARLAARLERGRSQMPTVEFVSETLIFPTCGTACPGYNRRPRAWRHLGTMLYRALVRSAVPAPTKYRSNGGTNCSDAQGAGGVNDAVPDEFLKRHVRGE